MAQSGDSSPRWGYEGDTGPEHWGDLAPELAICSTGRNQSPIDIVETVQAELSPLEVAYRSETVEVVHDGHSVRVDVAPGSSISVEGRQFELRQFHFHSPSEHRLRGEVFPLEAHFVHEGRPGELAVVGVLFRDGPAHAGLGRIWSEMPKVAGESRPMAVGVGELGLVPEELAYYRYNGSLTTPPCTEGVRWYVLRSTASLSAEQVATFVEAFGETARAPQPLNARLVLE